LLGWAKWWCSDSTILLLFIKWNHFINWFLSPIYCLTAQWYSLHKKDKINA
jgi:hypothetical protein